MHDLQPSPSEAGCALPDLLEVPDVISYRIDVVHFAVRIVQERDHFKVAHLASIEYRRKSLGVLQVYLGIVSPRMGTQTSAPADNNSLTSAALP